MLHNNGANGDVVFVCCTNEEDSKNVDTTITCEEMTNLLDYRK